MLRVPAWWTHARTGKITDCTIAVEQNGEKVRMYDPRTLDGEPVVLLKDDTLDVNMSSLGGA